MRRFTLSQFASALVNATGAISKTKQLRLIEAAELVKKTAESYIGNKQPEWPELKASTLRIKDALGYGAKGILERTGEMKGSITYRIEPYSAIIESYNRALYHHEKGTIYMAKRPVLSLAAFKKAEEIAIILGRAVLPITQLHRYIWS